MPFEIMIRSRYEEQLYVRSVAARLAGVTLDFWVSCEEEGLVVSHRMTGGGRGFRMTDIQQMELVWRLHRDLEIDLAAVDIVLRMRRQIIDLKSEVESLQRRAEERDRE
jgi:DNA-binding transcriptional MerR regulator